MNARLRQLTTLIHVLGLTPSRMDARSRQVFHAAVYLAQELGLNLGYSFMWESQGPYSSKLTEDMYDLASGPSTILPFALNPEFTKRSNRILRLLRVPHNIKLEPARWLLLLAATHFLMNHAQVEATDVDRRLEAVDTDLPRYRPEAATVLAAA